MMWVDIDGCIIAAQYCKYFITSVEKGITTSVKNAVLSTAARQVHRRQLHRHPGQRRSRAGSLPRLRRQGPASLQSELAQIKTQIENGTIKPATKSPV